MDKLKNFIKAFLTLFAVMRLMEISTTNPVSIILFIAIFYIYNKLSDSSLLIRLDSADNIISCILAVIFTGFTVAAKYSDILGGLTSGLFILIIMLVSFVGLFLLYYNFCMCILGLSDNIHIVSSMYAFSWLPYITFFGCLVAWLPYFLHAYPGTMTPDSINQYAQVIKAYELSNHHPVVHTLIIGFFYNIGMSLTGDVYFSLALYTIFQMVFMAFAAGFTVRTLQKAGINTAFCIITACFYAFMPYNGAYVTTIWKDILFAGNVTVFTASVLGFLIRDKEQKFTISEYFTLVIPYTVSGIFVCLLRSNGWYAFLITLPFLLFTFRHSLKKMIPIHIVILAIVIFIKYPCMEVYEIKQPDFVESLSIPVQQIARVISNGEALTDSQYSKLSCYINIDKITETYTTSVSDGIKNLIRESGNEYLETHKTDFLSLWFSIGSDHPKAYFDAFVDQTVGYWYPDVYYTVGLDEGIYPNEFGLSWQPVLKGSIIIKLKEIMFKLQEIIPLYGLLWSMGMIFWTILVTVAISLHRKRPANVLIAIPAIAIVITLCMATPVATEFRYSYALFYSLPLYIAAAFI